MMTDSWKIWTFLNGQKNHFRIRNFKKLILFVKWRQFFYNFISMYNLRIRNLLKTNLFAFFALNQGVIIDLNLQLILKCPCCPQFLHSLFGQFKVSWPTFALKSWHKKHTASIFLLKTWLNLNWNKINFDLWFFLFWIFNGQYRFFYIYFSIHCIS